MSSLRTAVALALIHVAAAQKNPYVDATNTYVDLSNLVNYTIPSSRCASPSSYEACVNPVTTQFANCLDEGGDEGEIQDCASAATKLTLQCVYANCWNIVSPESVRADNQRRYDVRLTSLHRFIAVKSNSTQQYSFIPKAHMRSPTIRLQTPRRLDHVLVISKLQG